MLLSWYILSLKPKGKGDCKYLIHLSSVSCLLIFFNLVDELVSKQANQFCALTTADSRTKIWAVKCINAALA